MKLGSGRGGLPNNRSLSSSHSIRQRPAITEVEFRNAWRACREVYLATLVNPALDGRDLRMGNLFGTFLSGVLLRRANLEQADLGSATLEGANLEWAKLDGANRGSARLERLDSASLDDVNLASANLEGATLRSASLRGANLTLANLEGANLSYARLRGAILDGANVGKASFFRAKLDDTWFSGLRGANIGFGLAELNRAHLSRTEFAPTQ
jgi:hypothetical protein